jgi:8-oxo-dGTP pyrophosphatase MutT (NUDIX family)
MKSRVRASAVVIHNERILCIRAQDPKSKKDFFFLPGGEVEPEETSVEAAERETFEETGFSVKVDALSRIYFSLEWRRLRLLDLVLSRTSDIADRAKSG